MHLDHPGCWTIQRWPPDSDAGLQDGLPCPSRSAPSVSQARTRPSPSPSSSSQRHCCPRQESKQNFILQTLDWHNSSHTFIPLHQKLLIILSIGVTSKSLMSCYITSLVPVGDFSLRFIFLTTLNQDSCCNDASYTSPVYNGSFTAQQIKPTWNSCLMYSHHIKWKLYIPFTVT